MTPLYFQTLCLPHFLSILSNLKSYECVNGSFTKKLNSIRNTATSKDLELQNTNCHVLTAITEHLPPSLPKTISGQIWAIWVALDAPSGGLQHLLGALKLLNSKVLLLPMWRWWWLVIGCYFWMDVIFHVWLDLVLCNERVVYCLFNVDITQCTSSCIIFFIARLTCHMQNVKAPTPQENSSWVGWWTTSVLLSPNAWLRLNDNQPFF